MKKQIMFITFLFGWHVMYGQGYSADSDFPA